MKKKLEHIAIIMDGNGRWAKKNKLKVYNGHKKGVEQIESVLKVANEHDVKYITLYAFSTENWKRDEEEINGLLKLIDKFYKTMFKKLLSNNIKVNIIGRKEGVPKKTQDVLDKIEEESKNNDNITLNIAFNYSSRLEIVDAVNLINKNNKEITEEEISKHLYTQNMPDVDLLIRTSGEQRISNFLLWQISYAELKFVNTLWPDFTEKEFEKCIEDYYNRDRRFGGR